MIRLYFYVFICMFAYKPGTVAAHPHQFVDYGITVLTDASSITGVDVVWRVDEMISSWIIDDYKLEKGKRYTGDEFIKYSNEVFYDLLKLYYYVIADYDGKPVKPQRWRNTVMTVADDGLLEFTFTLPFNIPLTGAGGLFSFRFEDESFYVDFALQQDMVAVTGPGAGGAVIKTVKDDYASSVAITFTQ